jgi:hypothetical protein
VAEERLPAAERATIAVDEGLVRPLVEKTAHPRVQPVLRVAGIAAGVAIVAVFSLGVVMLATMLKWCYVALGVVVLSVLPVAVDRWRVARVLAVGAVAVAVAVMGLLGVDVIWAFLRFDRPVPELGLAMAAVVVTGVTYAYLRWVGKPPPPHHGRWALFTAASGLGLAWITRMHAPELRLVAVAGAVGLATRIYLRRTAGTDIKRPLLWALLLAVIALIAAPLVAQAFKSHHHRVYVVLLIAGAAAAAVAGINGLWRPGGSKERRRARWAFGTIFAIGLGVPLLALAFVAVVPRDKPRVERILPAAAAPAPLPQRVLDHRPILLFDSGEEFRTPLDVDEMLESHLVELCPKGTGLLTGCRRVDAATDLRGRFGNLRFDTQQIEDEHFATTIYAHEVPDKLDPGWIDVDYWWYLPDNPARTAQGALCGAGFVIPEITCFDHQSDWEGATVVLGADDEPVAVRYATHEHVINVPWPTLQTALKGKALRPYAAGRDVANHPLVFVARGTHAGYPAPCRSSVCDTDKATEDNSHDGRYEWPEKECRAAGCVTPFPRSAAGGDASWNAFDGQWGSAECIVKVVYCSVTEAPSSPGQQHRYTKPWCYDLAVGRDLSMPHPVPARAPECKKG